MKGRGKNDVEKHINTYIYQGHGAGLKGYLGAPQVVG